MYKRQESHRQLHTCFMEPRDLGSISDVSAPMLHMHTNLRLSCSTRKEVYQLHCLRSIQIITSGTNMSTGSQLRLVAETTSEQPYVTVNGCRKLPAQTTAARPVVASCGGHSHSYISSSGPRSAIGIMHTAVMQLTLPTCAGRICKLCDGTSNGQRQ